MMQRSPFPVIPVEDLRQAHTADKAWVVIRDQVYDLTTFISRHPGGPDILLMAAGKDVTGVFESYHKPQHYLTLKKYAICSLSGHDVPSFPPPDDFSKTVRRRAEQYFSDNNVDPKSSPVAYIRYAATVILVVYIYLWQWSLSTDSFWIFYSVAGLYGFALSQYCVSVIHDASHGAIGHSPKLWRLLISGHDLFNGCSSLLWTYQHVLSHHVFTNVDGFDADVETVDGGYRRIKSMQKYLEFYKLQYVYAPVLYALLGMAVRIEDVEYYFAERRGPLKVNPLTLSQHALFWGGKLFFFCTRIFLPLVYGFPLSTVISAFLVTDFVFSVYLATIFQATHIVEGVSWPQVDAKSGNINMDWGRLQVETAQDYAHGQPITTFFSGSLNYQVVHHLFPNVAQEHLIELGSIVRQVAEEFGVNYVVKDTLWRAIGGHIGLLKMMGTPPHSLDG